MNVIDEALDTLEALPENERIKSLIDFIISNKYSGWHEDDRLDFLNDVLKCKLLPKGLTFKGYKLILDNHECKDSEASSLAKKYLEVVHPAHVGDAVNFVVNMDPFNHAYERGFLLAGVCATLPEKHRTGTLEKLREAGTLENLYDADRKNIENFLSGQGNYETIINTLAM